MKAEDVRNSINTFVDHQPLTKRNTVEKETRRLSKTIQKTNEIEMRFSQDIFLANSQTASLSRGL